jgi:DNA-nicking Smr family endonuclease
MSTGPAPRRRRGRSVSADERALWRFATRDAEPLAGRAALVPEVAPEPAPEPPPPAPAPAALKSATKPQPVPVTLPPLHHRRAPGLDARSSEKLKRGQLPIEGRLDLHGMSQEQARRALDHFIAEAFADGRRALLVITGKGLRPRPEHEIDPWHGAGRGILKQAVPRWLNEAPNRARVLAFTDAQPRHGGDGALYVLIRRQRE